MSEMSSLSELARIVGDSKVTSESEFLRRRVRSASSSSAGLAPQRRSVSELLGAVLALSARTRRMVLPYQTTDLDVFCPGGGRAVRIVFGPRD